MFLEYIKLSNYRPYYGSHTLNLRGKDSDGIIDKKIVLIGGLNGHGKTSLINAINICLFGHRKFKNQKEYYEYLNESVNNRYKAEGGKESTLELGFTDNSEAYAIRVNFNYYEQKEIRQIFQLNNNLEPQREIKMTDEDYYDFIDKRIPVDVSQFYIFDAEKTRELVGDQEKEETFEAIQQIMSLKTYNQLKLDLEHLGRQTKRDLKDIATEKEIKDLIDDLEKIVDKIDKVYIKIQENNKNIELLTSKEINLSIKRRKILSQNNEDKKSIAKKIGTLENEIKIINDKIIKSKDKLFELILQPHLNQLKKDVQLDQKIIKKQSFYQTQFNFYDDFINELLNAKVKPKLRNKQKKQLKQHGKDIWAKLNDFSYDANIENKEPLHDLSNKEVRTIMNLEETKNFNIIELIDQKQKYEILLEKLNKELNDAPEHINTEPLEKEIAKLNQEIGRLKQENRQLNQQMSELNKKKNQKESQLESLQTEKTESKYLKEKNELISKTILAIEEFTDKITKIKAEELKYEIEAIIEQLFRKKDFKDIHFDKKTFQLTIYNQYGNKMDLNSRSEGEKQLISLAMIWALTKVSGFNFPFVIDTPLARLDNSHRLNLVHHYFTKLSDQVIILSTDTEIDEPIYNELKPFLRATYMLIYDNDNDKTIIEENYYFEKEV